MRELAVVVLVLFGVGACAHLPEAQVNAAVIVPSAQIPPCRVLASPPSPPGGWSFLPEISSLCVADIYHEVARGSSGGPLRQIEVHTRQDVGILVRPTNVKLTATTTLKWTWNVAQLPSKLSEDVAQHHDYLSIAVKFDNGQDLTYMWSAALQVGKGFRCPLPTWDTRETHVVVRSDPQDLGKWLSEERHVQADYARHIGGKPPKRITQVWLIANSLFQQGEGVAGIGDISVGAQKRTRIF